MKTERIIGAALALVASVGTIAIGIAGGLSALETFWRAAAAAAAGWVLGWALFGRLGTAVVREAAGEDARARAAGEKTATRPPAGT